MTADLSRRLANLSPEHIKALVGKLGQTTADGAITVEAAYCLGNCALSPAVMVDDKLVGRVDARKFETIVAECRS